MPGERLGDVAANLQGAIDAVNKHRGAVDRLEKDADRRKKVLEDQAASEEKQAQQAAERGTTGRKVRKANIAAVEEESAAIEGGARRFAGDTAAIESNTTAIAANTQAKRANAAASRELSASEAQFLRQKYPVPGQRGSAISTYEQQRLYEEAVGHPEGRQFIGPLRPGPRPGVYENPALISQAQRDAEAAVGRARPYEYERAYVTPSVRGSFRPGQQFDISDPATFEKFAKANQEQASRQLTAEERLLKEKFVYGGVGQRGAINPPVTGPLLSGSFGPGHPEFSTSDPKAVERYGRQTGLIAEANRARKAEAKALAATEVEASSQIVAAKEAEAAKVVPLSDVNKRVAEEQAVRGVPGAQIRPGEAPLAGATSTEDLRLARLAAAEDLRDAQARYNRQEAATQRARPSNIASQDKLAAREAELEAARQAHEKAKVAEARLASPETPEGFYQQELASRRLEARQPLGTAVADLGPAITATRATEPYREQVQGIEKAAQQEKQVLSAKAAEELAYAEEAERAANRAKQASLFGTTAQGPVAAGETALFGGYGGKPPPPPPPRAAAGAGGAGDGGEGKIRAVSAAEEQAIGTEQRLAAVRAESNALTERSVGAYASSSQALQRHGALTAEFLQALARGEVTLKEFESQLVTTIGKFAGWAVAGGLVYGAYEAIKKVFDGAIQTQSAVAQLKRSLGEGVNVPLAEEGFRRTAQEVNVSIREVGDAQFYSARVFHNQADSLALAGTALRAYKLDNVNTQDAIKAFGALNVAFGSGPVGLKEAFDQLDVGQLKFNARLQQTLPQVGRAAASFAAAGGSQKELIDQIIQINRATGGGGGTGGGNPATALLREPANLTRPESEQVLRRYGIDPKFAKEHIGLFNQAIQEKAPYLKESDLQALAKAAGAGAGVGFRYLLPLYRLGRTPLPEEERAATEHAQGSAAEDLRHKLGQLDEQIKRLGVDFEVFGSHVGGSGITQGLADIVGVLNTTIKATGLVVHPFVALGDALSNIPAPIRQIIEAVAGFYGLRALSQSRIGATAKELASESPLFLKGSQDPEAARKVRSVLVAQREDAELLAGERTAALRKVKTAGRDVERSAVALERYEKTPAEVAALGPVGTTERDVYESGRAKRLAALQASLDKQLAASDEAVLIENEQNQKKLFISALEDRKIKVTEKAVLIQEKEAYGVGGGPPTLARVIAPNERRAIEEQQRFGGAATLGAGAAVAQSRAITAKATGPLGESTENLGKSAAVLNTQAEDVGTKMLTATLLLGQGGAESLERASTRARELGGKLAGLGGGLLNFAKNLGPLGKGIAIFAGIDIANQLDGANREFERNVSSIQTLAHPSSRSDLERTIKQAPKGRDFGDFLKDTFSTALQIPQHPEQAIEAFGAALGLGGNTHPQTFSVSARVKVEDEARAKQQLLKEGRLGFPGEGGGAAAAELFQAEEEKNAGNLLSRDAKKVEDSQKKITENLKLRLSQLEEFHGAFGLESIDFITRQISGLSNEFEETGSQTAFEALAKADREGTAGVLKSSQTRLALYGKFAKSSKEQDQILGESEAEIDVRAAGINRDLASARATGRLERLGIAGKREKLSPGQEEGYEFRPDTGLRGFPLAPAAYGGVGEISPEQHKQEVDAYEKAVADNKNKEVNRKHHEEAAQREAKELDVGRAANRLGSFELDFLPQRAEASLHEAEAGPNKLRKAEIALVLARQEEAEAVKRFGKDRLNFAALAAAKEKVVKAAEEVVAGHQAEIERHTRREVAELPIGAPASAKSLKEAAGAAAQEAYIKSAKLPKAVKDELLEEANTKNKEAIRAAAESVSSEAKQNTQLAAQIAQARDAGNALAQAADAEAGAAKELAEAKKPAERKQAELSAINARNQRQQAEQAHIVALGTLRESTEANPLEKDRTKIDTLEKELRKARPDEKLTLQASLNDEKRKYHEDKATEEIDEIKFREHTHQITSQQGIEGLQRVLRELKRQHAPKQRIRQIESEIYDAQNEATRDFAVGSIAQAPTLYDAKTLTRRGAGPTPPINFNAIHHPPQLHQVNHIQVNVAGGHGAGERVAAELERHFQLTTKSQLRSAGLT